MGSHIKTFYSIIILKSLNQRSSRDFSITTLFSAFSKFSLAIFVFGSNLKICSSSEKIIHLKLIVKAHFHQFCFTSKINFSKSKFQLLFSNFSVFSSFDSEKSISQKISFKSSSFNSSFSIFFTGFSIFSSFLEIFFVGIFSIISVFL
jgi:hypothetical protein